MNVLAYAPKFSTDEASEIANELFDLQVSHCQPLPSERDQNFLIADSGGNQFVLKVANSNEATEFLEGQNELLQHLAQANANCQTPKIISTRDGKLIEQVAHGEQSYLVRLITFLVGRPLAAVGFRSPELLFDLGRCVAEVDVASSQFDHSAFHRDFHWDLAKAPQVVAAGMNQVEKVLRDQVEEFIGKFETHTAPRLGGLPKSVIHNDANDGNVIVDFDSNDPAAKRVCGLVDFGDAVFSWTIGNLAIAVAYGMLEQVDPMAAAKSVVQGYYSVRPIDENEVACIFGLAVMRLCQSAVIAAEQVAIQPENEYLAVSQEPIRVTLPKLRHVTLEFAEHYFATECGLLSSKHAKRCHVNAWLANNQKRFAFPVNPKKTGQRPASEKTLVLNLGVDSLTLPSDLDSLDEPKITQHVFGLMKQNDADVVIGRYLEPRCLYQSDHFVGGDLACESRTIHLGIDIFAVDGTAAVAAMEGCVFSVGAINKPLDYGGLVILQHSAGNGESFFTLYGHLDPESTTGLKVGDSVSCGQKIAELGCPEVNGGWTPHVHFQIIHDLVGMEHGFPGVSLASQVAAWSTLSPDPNLMLGMDAACFPQSSLPIEQTKQQREIRIGGSVALSYDHPLKIVRGWKQYLFDHNARRILDAYNNVPHVGHGHPKVVQAIQRQAAVLNTNTRYLHDNINRLAEKISETTPDSLDVCYFVNSATEANELALRIARTCTGRRDLVVLEHAYHGHTSTLIDISPYKNAGPGGEGHPDWVHVAPIADIYRGAHKDPATAAESYAEDLAKVVAEIDGGLCGFICETCPSVGGQIVFPDGYLKRVYETVRAAGGLCIADEVQTGYGRLGNAMYGFELQEVVPDILILGKPIGNGHPLAAVVTRRALADEFNNGMEYFSTFGGNPVSCAAGLAVLDVLQEESLMQNARVVGDELLRGLRQLQAEFDIIGDVRGLGFFLGVELVRDRQSLEPAAAETSFIVDRMKERGVLLGTDGPLHNVIKIRPPMCFTSENGTELLQQLRGCFELLG